MWKNHKVVLDGIVRNISLTIKDKSIGSIDVYDINSNGYYMVKLLLFTYKLHEITTADGHVLN